MLSSRGQQTKKTYHIQVGQQVLVLDVHISPDKYLISQNKDTLKRSSEWFKESHLQELLTSLKSIITTRINSAKPVTRVTYKNPTSTDITSQNLDVSYCFKKRSVILKQFALLKNDKIYHLPLNGKTRKVEKENYKSLSFFHEKLVVTVQLHVTEAKQQLTSVQLHETVEDKEIDATSSSCYFQQTDCLITSSVKRKKNSLKKIAKKSKRGLLKLPAESSTISIQEESDLDLIINHTTAGSTSSACNSNSELNVDEQVQKTVIDLEAKPEGLKNVRKVEDLQDDHLKFLINKMEDYLRTIFRGEIYCRRHEDYKKGGKERADLNFQVGMAHFSEDQHDCIMEALMAMFCYRGMMYMDYVTKVMLPEALIKLYQDVHNTSFEEAEECLNDTIF